MKISVIIPVYNVEAYLEECLQSVISQSYKNLEIILINDGSTDHSGKICDQIANTDSRIKVIHQKNGGVSDARNTGINVATGDYFTFVDSDDWLDQNMYQKMAEETMLHNRPDVVMCDFINEKGNHTENITAFIRAGFYSKEEIIKELYPTLLVTEDFGRLPIVSVWSCLFRKEIFNFHKITFDTELRFSEDYLFMAEIMMAANSFLYLKNQYFYHYRQYEDSRSKKYQPEWWNNLLALHRKLGAAVGNNRDYDFTRQLKLQLIHSALFVTSAVIQSENIPYHKKHHFLKKIFEDPQVMSAFKHLKLTKKPLALKTIIFLMKHRFVYFFLIYRTFIAKIRKSK